MDPFYDLNSSEEINLGLTVSVQMLQDFGGRIEFLSGEKSGNHIRIFIPQKNQKDKYYEERPASTG